MATVTRQMFTCDACGSVKDVKTRAFELDDQAYEIDLCRKDGNALDKVIAGYAAKARRVARSARRRGDRAIRSARKEAKKSRPERQADVRQGKGIYVYGILPADIEVTEDVPGVGTDPGPLRDVCFNGLAALISEVDLSVRLGSPDDRRTHREILDAIAAELPVLPLSFGTVLPSEEAVAKELLAARHDEFADALEQLEGRAEFQVIGRYVQDAVPAGRERDTRALTQAMERLCVASIANEPAQEPDAIHVSFLVPVERERDVERVVENLAREWAGRIDVHLLGPMAAYDFAGPARPER